MLLYDYTAKVTATGQTVKASVQAESEQAAAALIHKEGLVPVDIRVHGGSGMGLAIPGIHREKVKIKEKVLFSRQLSTLINAGLPLVQALRNVAAQTQGKALKVVVSQVITDIEAGSAFSVALSKHPKVFNQVYVSLIQAGETSGTLDKSLERLAIQQEKDADVISKVRGAFVYPIIVLCVMTGVVIYMLLTVLPQVQILYDGIKGARLPIYTRMLLSVSNVIKHYWWALAIVLVLAIFFTTRWARTGPGKEVVDKAKMKSPLIGPLFMKMYMARFSRTGATLIGSGVPLIQVLEITASAVNNVHISASIHRAIEKVKGGKALSETLSGDENFLELVPDMLHIGEESGATEQMLTKTADYYEKEVDDQIKTISTIIEPVLMIVMGVMALIIVAAVLLPIYQLSGQTLAG
jgi:type IV pilus assembly protein PilC